MVRTSAPICCRCLLSVYIRRLRDRTTPPYVGLRVLLPPGGPDRTATGICRRGRECPALLETGRSIWDEILGQALSYGDASCCDEVNILQPGRPAHPSSRTGQGGLFCMPVVRSGARWHATAVRGGPQGSATRFRLPYEARALGETSLSMKTCSSIQGNLYRTSTCRIQPWMLRHLP